MAARLQKRADGRYQVTAMLDGKRMFFYGRTQAEAKAKAQAARDRVKAGAPVRDATRSLGDWLTEWIGKDLEASARAQSTKEMYAGYCRTWLIPTIGAVPLNKLMPADITGLVLTMQKAQKAGSTQRNCMDTLRLALDDAVNNGLLAVNPARKVKRPKAHRGEARFLTPDEVKALLRCAGDKRYSTVLRLILGTGMRRGEALALRWQDVDLQRAEVRVNGSLVRQGSRLVVSGTKTAGSRRTVSLSPQMVNLLNAHKEVQASERLLCGDRWHDTGLVFTTVFGRPVDPANLLRLTRDAASAANLSNVTVHTLRHTYATTALMNRVPLKVVSSNLGHASIQITADIYGHVTDDAARDAALKV